MCFGEQDMVNLKLFFAARRRYPGIRYHEETLQDVAREHGIGRESEVKALGPADLDELAADLVRALPQACRPRRASEEVA